jgi:hypothetical protein
LIDQTNEVAFRNFQARGGFLVSAASNAAGVYYLEIGAAEHPVPLDESMARQQGRNSRNGKNYSIAARDG